jgi:hypothetical protein
MGDTNVSKNADDPWDHDVGSRADDRRRKR